MNTKRPPLLIVLSILSAIFIFFNIYQEMVYLTQKDYFTGSEYFDHQEEAIEKLDSSDSEESMTIEMKKVEIEMRKLDNENYTRNHGTFLFIFTVGLISLLLMYQLNIKGVGLYAFYSLMEISNRYFIYREIDGFFQNYVILNIVLSLAFISAYYSVFYKLKKQNENA